MKRTFAVALLLTPLTSFAADQPPCWPHDTPPIIRTNVEGFAAVWGCRQKYVWKVTGFVGRWSELSPANITSPTLGRLLTDSTPEEKAAAWNTHIDGDWDAPRYRSLTPLRDDAIKALNLVNPPYRVKDNPVSSTRPVYAFSNSTPSLRYKTEAGRIPDTAVCDCSHIAIEEGSSLYCPVSSTRVALCVPR